MMLYDFKCNDCGAIRFDHHLPITHADDEVPKCCGEHMAYYITSVPHIHWKDYDLPDGGFRSVATPGREVITSLKQKREYMKRHNLLDANEVTSKVTESQQRQDRAEISASIDAITPTDAQRKQLRDDGILDIVE